MLDAPDSTKDNSSDSTSSNVESYNDKEEKSSFLKRISELGPIAKISSFFESLSSRDRRLFLFMLSVVIIAFFGVSSLWGRSYIRRLNEDIDRKKDQLARIQEIESEHTSLVEQIKKLEDSLKSGKDFNLTAFLERVGNDISFPSPISIQSKGEASNNGFSEKTMEVRIRKAPLDKVTKYLYQVEGAPERLNVKTMRIRTAFGSRSDLDADFEISYLIPQETESR